MSRQLVDKTDSKSQASLIAWLGVCLLAAGWGTAHGPEWKNTLMIVGTFGLVSALGLAGIKTTREQRRRKRTRVIVQKRVQRSIPQRRATDAGNLEPGENESQTEIGLEQVADPWMK